MSLQVILAGHNGDIEVLRTGEGEFTPETLSAAYARISRSPEPVPELRQKARAEVEASRKSNQTIVFGLGHHSVAEHAVFNFDILGLSRLAIEALEWHRLCSYTEKSQRYISLDGDWVMPSEFKGDDAQILKATVEVQNAYYHTLLPKLIEAQHKAHPHLVTRKQDRAKIEGWAKEDARYVVSLATEGQLGFTANARNLELVIRRFRHSPLAEVRQIGQLLFEQARVIAPSLIILADEENFKKAHGATVQDAYFEHAAADLRNAMKVVRLSPVSAHSLQQGDVTLVDHTSDPDTAVISALLFSAGLGPSTQCVHTARALRQGERKAIVARALAHMSQFDAPPRAFEEATFRFEIVLDASAMAQLKRHRMSTQQWGPYDPDLDVTIPDMISEIGETADFMDVMNRTNEAWAKLRKSMLSQGLPVKAADYVLTNAHRRRVTMTANLRELYHFSRMREDSHAQWAIRQIAHDMSRLVRTVAPATGMLLAGKDCFDGVAQSVSDWA